MRDLLCWLQLSLLAAVSSAYPFVIVQGEPKAWTSTHWGSLQLRFPAEALVLGAVGDRVLEELTSRNGARKPSQLESLRKVSKEARQISPAARLEQAKAMADLLGCKMCHAAVLASWELGVARMRAGLPVLTREDFINNANSFCSQQANRRVLSDVSIEQVDMSSLGAHALTGLGPDVSFPQGTLAFVLQARGDGSEPTALERQAVANACSAFYREADGNIAEDSAFELLSKVYLPMAERDWQAALFKEGLTKASLQTAQKTAGKELESCADLHPECAKWASENQCWVNPGYMLGDEDQFPAKGHCRLSCAVCSPPPLAGLTPEVEEALALHRDALLKELLRSACDDATACSLAGAAQKVLNRPTPLSGAMPTPSSPSSLPGAARSLGTSGVLQTLPQASVAPSLWESNRATSSPVGAPLSGSLRAPLDKTGEGQAQQLAALAGNCYYSESGWWTLELCPGAHVRQFHKNVQTGAVDPIVELGGFLPQNEVSAGEVLLLADEDCLPGLAGMPSLSEIYTQGESCLPASNQLRDTEVRYACSPTQSLYLLLREPEECRYVVTLYHPQLCAVPELALSGGSSV